MEYGRHGKFKIYYLIKCIGSNPIKGTISRVLRTCLIGGIGRHGRFRFYLKLVLVQIQYKVEGLSLFLSMLKVIFLFKTIHFWFFFYWLNEYSFLVSYFFVLFLFVFFLWFLVTNLTYTVLSFEKTSQYECGFEPFGFNSVFDLQYFLIALLYLVFDVELVLIIPWILGLSGLSFEGIFSMLFFLILFVVGLIFEWTENILHWT